MVAPVVPGRILSTRIIPKSPLPLEEENTSGKSGVPIALLLGSTIVDASGWVGSFYMRRGSLTWCRAFTVQYCTVGACLALCQDMY